MPAGLGGATLRSKLSALLPRLRRFALLLAGDADSADTLLRLAFDAIMTEPSLRPANMPVEHWALSRVYSIWLDDLRGRREPMAQTRADEDLLRLRLTDWGMEGLEAPELAGFLSALPPQQRAAIVLVYGEGLSYDAAAAVLDAPVDAVSSRVSRALAGLVERLGLQRPETPASAEVAMLYPEQEQATS